MFPRLLIISTRQGRLKNSLFFKDRARVGEGEDGVNGHDDSPHPYPAPYVSPVFVVFSPCGRGRGQRGAMSEARILVHG
jgi:hypothetical protein